MLHLLENKIFITLPILCSLFAASEITKKIPKKDTVEKARFDLENVQFAFKYVNAA